MAALTDISGFRTETRKPPATGPTAAEQIASFREIQVVNPSGVSEPTLVTLDLTDWVPTVEALVELVVPLARNMRSGALGPLSLVVCTADGATREVLRALATADDLALFVAPAPERLAEAEPFGRLTETERRTLETLHSLGGAVSVSAFAEATGLAAPAATNRLVSVADKGFVRKLDRPRPAGALFIDPRSAIVAHELPVALPPAVRHEIDIFAAVAGHDRAGILALARAEFVEHHGVGPGTDIDAWLDYRKRHAGQLSERLRWAQEMLDDPQQAAVEMSGMSTEHLEELRREFD